MLLIDIEFGTIFELIGSRERQLDPGEAFRKFGMAHRKMAKEAQSMLNKLKPMMKDLGAFLAKVSLFLQLVVHGGIPVISSQWLLQCMNEHLCNSGCP